MKQTKLAHAHAKRGGTPARPIGFSTIMRALRVVGIIEEYGWNQAAVRKRLLQQIKAGKIRQPKPRGPYIGNWKVYP